YPHHNVYWITSDSWDLRALKALLRSTISVRQVGAYSVQMRGGSVRWQAQTLRRVRVPLLRSLTDAILVRLIGVADSTRQAEIDEVAEEAYGTFLTS
ncbi:MAG: Eco57I restriction-modification methylase domain-containing protein, partial [Gemmatimonadaceae bacterium]